MDVRGEQVGVDTFKRRDLDGVGPFGPMPVAWVRTPQVAQM